MKVQTNAYLSSKQFWPHLTRSLTEFFVLLPSNYHLEVRSELQKMSYVPRHIRTYVPQNIYKCEEIRNNLIPNNKEVTNSIGYMGIFTALNVMWLEGKKEWKREHKNIYHYLWMCTFGDFYYLHNTMCIFQD